MTYGSLKASDGTGEAVLAHVTANRLVGSTTLLVDSVDNWPTNFIVVTGTINANGFISPSGMTQMRAHISGGNIAIDSFEPGYTDIGNTTSDVCIIKMTTEWANDVARLALVSHNDDGTLKNDVITTPDQFTDPVDPALRFRENCFDHIASGGVLTGTGYGSTLGWSLTAGVVYINGKRYTFAAATGLVTASKDTYFDLLEPVSGNVATLVVTGGNIVNNNAASPALAANSVRLGIIQAGATIVDVARINQGQENKMLPIASGVAYTVTDTLGNLICPRDPNRRILGYRQITSDFSTTSTSGLQDVPGLSVPVLIPEGRKIIISSEAISIAMSGGSPGNREIGIKEGASLLYESAEQTSGNYRSTALVKTPPLTHSAGLHTYKIAVAQNAAGTLSLFASAGLPAFILVELV